MKKTSVHLDDALHFKLKRIAEKKGKSLGLVIEDLLMKALEINSEKQELRKVPTHRNNGPQMGVDISDRHKLYELLVN